MGGLSSPAPDNDTSMGVKLRSMIDLKKGVIHMFRTLMICWLCNSFVTTVNLLYFSWVNNRMAQFSLKWKVNNHLLCITKHSLIMAKGGNIVSWNHCWPNRVNHHVSTFKNQSAGLGTKIVKKNLRKTLDGVIIVIFLVWQKYFKKCYLREIGN